MFISYKYSLLHTLTEVGIHQLFTRLSIIHPKHEAPRCRNKQRIAKSTLFVFHGNLTKMKWPDLVF